MYAIIKEENGQYYTSTVFGCYNCKDHRNRCWIVLNKEKNALVKHFVFKPKSRFLELMLICTDSERNGWNDEKGEFSCVDFLPAAKISSMIDRKKVPTELLEQCIKTDSSYSFNEYPEIRSQKDIDDLYCATGGFHDAYIEKLEDRGDSLYILFEGIWGCKLEVWFENDVSYDTADRYEEPQTFENDPYWYGGTVVIRNDYIYLIDDCDVSVNDIENGYCYFRARKMKYHIIPD